MNNKKNKSNPFKTAFWFCGLSTAILVGLLLHSTQVKEVKVIEFLIQNIINILFAAIMVLFLFRDASGSRKKLNDITEALTILTQKIRNNGHIVKCSAICNNEFLKKYLEEFESDLKHTSGVAPDIADYINEHTIADFVHKENADQIGNVMTGLGILGTFVGLMVGLVNVDTENITKDIAPLLEGIKTAFLTSIFGIFASLIHTYFYNSDMEKNNSALEEFYGVFYDKVENYPEINFYNQVIVQNENEPTLIAKEVASHFGDLIVQTINPVIYNLNKSMDDYILRAVEKQSGVIRDLVTKTMEEFTDKLSESMDDEFRNLSRDLRDMRDWISDFKEKSAWWLESVAATTKSLAAIDNQIHEKEKSRQQINNDTNTLIESAKTYSEELKSYIDELNNWVTELKGETEKQISSMQMFEKLSEGNNSKADAIADRFNGIMKAFEQYEKTTNIEIGQHKDANSNIMNSLKDVAGKLDRSTNTIEDNLKSNAQSINAAVNKLVELNNKMMSDMEFLSTQLKALEKKIKK